jgi:hypothetical protein
MECDAGAGGAEAGQAVGRGEGLRGKFESGEDNRAAKVEDDLQGLRVAEGVELG